MTKPYEQWIADLKTPEACESFARNAERQGRKDLVVLAHRRAVELRAAGHLAVTNAEKEALRAVYAYEEALARKNGTRHRANRTWQMIKRHGIISAVERAVNRSEETQGYKALAEIGMQDYSFEAVVLRYPDLFTPETISRAKERVQLEG